MVQLTFPNLPLRGAALKRLMEQFNRVEGKKDGEDGGIVQNTKEKTVVRNKNKAKVHMKKDVMKKKPIVEKRLKGKDESTMQTVKKMTKPKEMKNKVVDEYNESDEAVAEVPKRKYTKRKNSDELRDEDTDSSIAEIAYEGEIWYEGEVRSEDLNIDKITFPIGQYFLGQYKILDVISIDNKKGTTYLAYGNGYEVVLRVNFIQNNVAMMDNEIKFLEKIELNEVQHLFGTLLDMGIINKEDADGIVYYATIYRGGPSLIDCLSFCNGSFTLETAGRLILQMIQIIEQIYRQGFLLLNMNPSLFRIDRRSRKLFLDDFSDIVAAHGLETSNLRHVVKNDRMRLDRNILTWNGNEDYAPLSWHMDKDNHIMSEIDSIESLLYLSIDIILGNLPWRNTTNIALKKKVVTNHDGPFMKDLSLPIRQLFMTISILQGKDITSIDFPSIYRMLSPLCPDEDKCYDWEVEGSGDMDSYEILLINDHVKDTLRSMATINSLMNDESNDNDETLVDTENID